jgi:hypothetical protein
VLRWIRNAVLFLTLGAASCSAQLPSETPLGLGPLARRPRAPEPSGAPVSMPGSGPQMQFDGDDEDSTAENETPSSTNDDNDDSTADAGTVTVDAGAVATTSTPANNAPAAALDFTGEYSGKDVSTFRVTGLGEQKEEDPNAKLSVKKTGDSLTIILVASNTGDPLCTLKAEQKGDTATLPAGQECTEPQSPFSRGKLTRGQAKLSGKQITLDMLLEVKGEVGGKQFSAAIDYHFEGTRR